MEEENIDKKIRQNVPLSDRTTFHIGGSAEYFVEIASVEDLRKAIAWAKECGVPVTVLGGGSNVFVADEGVKGLVIHNVIRGRDAEEHEDEVILTAGAGEVFDEVVTHAVLNGWWGLENLSCIPGLVGATPIQNIGAYGVEIKDRIVSVEVYDPHSDEVQVLAAKECAFGYRDSLFKHPEGRHYIVTKVTYRLSKTPAPVLHYRDLVLWNEGRGTAEAPTLASIREAVCAIRAKKFPDWTVLGTAGSFFKNPTISKAHFETLRKRFPGLPGYETPEGVKVTLGWILDRVLNVRGHREGNVGTYEGQALVLVNHGDATAAELEAFARLLAQKIFDATDIAVEWEVTKLS